MTVIRDIHVKNFRGIKELIWKPSEGVNCLIGPGDSCKSTILDAIDYTLSASRQINFTDADFHMFNCDSPIDIKVTVGRLTPELLNIDTYGHFHRCYDACKQLIFDEPLNGNEKVLTLRLIVNDDLEPVWSLYSKRANERGIEQNLKWVHRQLLSPLRLGSYADYHMAWGRNSILNKLSKDKAETSSALAAAGRQARRAFKDEGITGVENVLTIVKKVSSELGINILEAQACLDVHGISFNGGAIGLHDINNIPLKRLGTGSSRLLICGLQKHITGSPITIIDEVEHGLEPYRIVRLLDTLGVKDQTNSRQLFMTTHSPVVLMELKAEQLCIVLSEKIITETNEKTNTYEIINKIKQMVSTDHLQKLLRGSPEAFLSPRVIVCEGKTEIGIVKGLDLHKTQSNEIGLISSGCYWANGGGFPQLFSRALSFAEYGYETVIFMDSDIAIPPEENSRLKNANIRVFRWADYNTVEDSIFQMVPQHCIATLLSIACDWKGENAVNHKIKIFSEDQLDLIQCKNFFQENMRLILSKCSKEGDWFKDIEPAERIMKEVIGPNWNNCIGSEIDVLSKLYNWAISKNLKNVAKIVP